jgi:Skp family chaperone for outer membrane proteins
MTKSILWPAVLLIALVSSSAFAQRPAATTPTQRPAAAPVATQPAPAPQTAVAIPTSKLALIYTDAFADPKLGLLKLNNMLTKLNAEFQKPKDDLVALSNRAQQLDDEIKKLQQATGAPIDQKSLQAKITQLDQLKTEIQRKNEDATASFNRRKQEVFAPLQEEIGKAIEAFAKAHGINVIVDAAQVPLLYAADSIDVTKAFITEFNSKNPVTASTTPPE